MPIEFYAAYEGYQEKQFEQTKIMRFASFRVAESMAGSKAIGSIERFWPMLDDKDNKKEIEPMTKDRYDAILQRHNLKIK